METSKELGQLMRCDGKEHRDSDEKDNKSRDKEYAAGTTEDAALKKGS